MKGNSCNLVLRVEDALKMFKLHRAMLKDLIDRIYEIERMLKVLIISLKNKHTEP